MPQRALVGLAWTGILLVALFLRFHNLETRPVHFDEATGARFVAQHMEDGGYRFLPEHFHGPILSMAAAGLSRLRGEDSWQSLNIWTLRLVPAVAGVLLVLVPVLWTRQIGTVGTLAAGTLLATSPLLVYYSRMFIHESLLALFAILSLTALLRLVRKPSLSMALLSGILVGLMWSTKETFVITLFAWAVAALFINAAQFRQMGPYEILRTARRYQRHILLGILGMISITACMYTNGFRNPEGLLDPVRTFFLYETVPGHEKGFVYYLHMLLWPKWRAGGLWWEGPVILLGAAFLIPVMRNSLQEKQFRLCAFLAVVTALQFMVYSLIGYKTPWLMVGPWAHAGLLGGASFGLVINTWPKFRSGLVAVLLAIAGFQSYQSLQAIGRFESDTRNPYAYVPTQRDVEATANWLTSVEDSIAPDTLGTIGVLGSNYWPLPWYLRRFDSIGYWQEADNALKELSVVFAMPGQFEAADELLAATHVALPRGLREDAPMILHMRKDVWSKWMEDAP